MADDIPPLPEMVPGAEERGETVLAHLNNGWHDGPVVISQALATAFRDGALAERARIVEMLREPPDTLFVLLSECMENVAWDDDTPNDLVKTIRDYIERGAASPPDSLTTERRQTAQVTKQNTDTCEAKTAVALGNAAAKEGRHD